MKRLFLASSIGAVAKQIAKQIELKNPKLALITTASEVEEGDLSWIEVDKNSLKDNGFDVTEYTITGKSKEEVKSFLEKFDIIFFLGGNTFYLLQQVQKANIKNLLKNFVEDGKIYIGSSAGSIIAGPDIFPINDLDNIKCAPDIKGYVGLGLVNFVVLPHWGSKWFEDKYLKYKMKANYKVQSPLVLLNDNQFIKVEGDKYQIFDIRNV